MVSKILAELKNSEWGHSERVRPALSSRVWSSLVLLAGGRRNRATEAATPSASVVANRVVEISQRSRERSSSSFSSSTVRTSSTNRRSVASMLRSGGNSGGGGGSGGRRGTRRSNYDGIHDNADPTSPATQSDPINDVGGRKGRVARLTHFTSGQSFDEFNDEDENPEEPDPTGIVDLDDVKIPTPAMATATSSIGANNQFTMNSNTTNSFNSRSTVSYDGGGISYTPPSSVGSNSYQGSLQSAPDHYRDRRREDGGGPSFEKENSHSLTNPDRHHSSFRNSNSTSYKSIIFAESISLSRSLATLERNAFRSLALMPPSSLPNPIQNVDRNTLSNEVADALDQDIGTWTALHFACDRQDEKGARIVELMLSAGADPCIENSAGDTPLHLAVDAGNDSSVLALLQCGAKADAFDTRGVGPLHIACKRGNARVTHWLLTFGKASPNKLTERSKSALHYAINGALSSTQNHSGVTDCVDLLLAAGANPNVASRPSLETPLHIAARCGHSKVVSALMRRGANVRLANCDKDEPQKIALRYGHTAVAKQITGHWRIAYFLLMELAARDVVTLRVMPVVGPDQDVNLTREASVLLNVGKKLPKNIKAQICKFL
jgi:ankyrin repeat protein